MTHPHTMDDKLSTGRGIVIGVLITFSAGFVMLAIMSAGFCVGNAQLARIDTVKQEHFVAQPRSIASARKDSL